MPRYPSTSPHAAVIIGGAEDRVGKASLLRAVRQARRRAPRAGSSLIPTASSFRDEVVASYTEVFTRLGAPGVRRRATPRPAPRPTTPTLVAALDDATGDLHERRQPAAALASCSPGTPVGRRDHRAHDRGAVVAGTSAGASIMSRLHDLDGRGGRHAAPARQPDHRRASAWSADVIVDQHFDQRSRYGRLMSRRRHRRRTCSASASTRTPRSRSRDGREFTVVGAGAVFVVDARTAVTDAAGRPAGAPLLVSGRHRAHPAHGRYVRPAQRRADRLRRAAPRPARRRSPPPRPDRPRSPSTSRPPDRHPRRSADGPSHPDRPRRPRPAHRRVPGLPRAATSGPTSPSIHLVVDLGVLEELPDRHPARLHRPAARAAARAGEPHLLQGRARAASSSGCARAPGWGTSPSTSPCSCSRRPGTTSAAARPARSRAARASTTSSTATPTRRSASPPAGSRCGCVNHLVQRGGRVRLRRGARALPDAGPSAPPSARRPAAIVEEAVSRDIPLIRLNSGSLVQLGQGVHQQRIRATMTSKTGALAVDIAGDKDLTTKLLGSAGPAGAQAGDGARRPTGRWPPPAGSASRSSSSRSTATTAAGCASTCSSDDEVRDGVRRRRGRVAPRLRHRRVDRDRPRLPLPHRRRPDAGHRRAGARPRHRRRHAHRRASSSRSPTPTRAAASATRRC